MILMNEIPDRFWSLFRSINRSAYVEALLKINEEYEYSNYFLSREMCIQLLNEYFTRKKYVLWQDETEDDWDALEPPATRVLNWLIRSGWLRKVDDYANMAVNIVIPDYAAVMIEAFAKLSKDEEDETELYIQNVYAILFSLKNDPRSSITLLNTALVNTKKLNKSLQHMLHNMDKFFGTLLEQKNFGTLLEEHLDHYVEEIVNKKYHILKTSDNFYMYKTDIKRWIKAMGQDEEWIHGMCTRPVGFFAPKAANVTGAGVMDLLDQLERGFDDIEHRIANMDKEHTRYVRATVTRLGYLLNQEDNMKGLVVQILNHLSEGSCKDEDVKAAAMKMNLSHTSLLSEKSLYKKRHTKAAFREQLKDEEVSPELSMAEVLDLNRVKNRYSKNEIEEFMESRMKNGIMEVDRDTVASDDDFQKLILAYDYSTRVKCPFKVRDPEPEMIHNGRYSYPGFVFVRRTS